MGKVSAGTMEEQRSAVYAPYLHQEYQISMRMVTPDYFSPIMPA